MFLLSLRLLDNTLLFILFGILVLERFVDLLLLLQVVLEKFDIMSILFNRLRGLLADVLHPIFQI